jgi:hypothetical protein
MDALFSHSGPGSKFKTSNHVREPRWLAGFRFSL